MKCVLCLLLCPLLCLAAVWKEREVPAGLPADVVERAQAATEAQVELGRRLFFDPVLSSDRTVACASCHKPEHGFADTEPLSTGVAGRRTTRNAPTLYNRALGRAFMWDGRAQSLEEQVLLPIANELEMDLPVDEAVARLGADDAYSLEFEAAFGGPPTEERLAAALAGFVRGILNGGTRVDRFHAGHRVVGIFAARRGSYGRCSKLSLNNSLARPRVINSASVLSSKRTLKMTWSLSLRADGLPSWFPEPFSATPRSTKAPNVTCC